MPINEEITATINRWGNANKEPNNFIFPILIDGVSAYRQRELLQDFTAIVNNWMKKIAESVGLNKKILTMTYRHTFATVLKRSGVSAMFIKEQLGHNDLKTTENYRDSFELDIKKEYSTCLMDFKKIFLIWNTIHTFKKKTILFPTSCNLFKQYSVLERLM